VIRFGGENPPFAGPAGSQFSGLGSQEKKLNSFPHFTLPVNGLKTHFIHQRSTAPPPGWDGHVELKLLGCHIHFVQFVTSIGIWFFHGTPIIQSDPHIQLPPYCVFRTPMLSRCCWSTAGPDPLWNSCRLAGVETLPKWILMDPTLNQAPRPVSGFSFLGCFSKQEVLNA
jgi:hypothetical protein